MSDIIVEAGDILIFSRGEYSDYRVEATCRALASFEVSVVAKRFIDDNTHPKPECGSDVSSFVLWLTMNNYISEDSIKEIYLGYSGSVSYLIEGDK